MTLRIDRVRSATEMEWNMVWGACDYATYFHSLEWADIWRKYSNGNIRPEPLAIDFSDGRSAILPLSVMNVCGRLVTRYHLSPGGTFGGWISVDKLTEDHAVQLTSFILERCKQLVWRLNPYDPLAAGSASIDAVPDETYALDLACGFEAIFKTWRKGHRSAATKARREGVIVREALSVSDWRAYFDAYEDSLRRWGDKTSSKYSWGLFEDLYRRESKNIKLWLSCHDNQVISGALCFYAKNHVVYWHGAALEAYLKLRPVHWGIHEAVRDACKKGYVWFDFNPSGGHEGVQSFKKGFGATPRPCPIVRISPLGLKIVTWALNKLRR